MSYLILKCYLYFPASDDRVNDAFHGDFFNLDPSQFTTTLVPLSPEIFYSPNSKSWRWTNTRHFANDDILRLLWIRRGAESRRRCFSSSASGATFCKTQAKRYHKEISKKRLLLNGRNPLLAMSWASSWIIHRTAFDIMSGFLLTFRFFRLKEHAPLR